jgi:hypothetical protein
MNRKLSQLEVQGCVGPGQGLKNVFDERQVKPLPKGSTQERVEAEHFGRELVLKGKVGDFVGIQNRAEDEDDTFWVAQLVDSQQGNKAHPHIYERVTERHKQIEHEGVKVGLNRGEYAFTVRFLERDASDPNRMTFLPPSGPVRLVNSSELRAIKLKNGSSDGDVGHAQEALWLQSCACGEGSADFDGRERERNPEEVLLGMPSLHYLKLGRTALGRTALGRMALGRTWHWAEIFP